MVKYPLEEGERGDPYHAIKLLKQYRSIIKDLHSNLEDLIADVEFALNRATKNYYMEEEKNGKSSSFKV